MNDAEQQRLDEIRAKLRRIEGHKKLSPKQFDSWLVLNAELLAEDFKELFK
jgi:hypothetical protein